MLKKAYKVGLILAIAGLLTFIIKDLAKQSSQRTSDNVYYSNFTDIVMVAAPGNLNRHGSGVFVKTRLGELVVLTNRHVCNNIGKELFLHNEIISATTEALYVDQEADLCLVKVPKPLNTKGATVARQNPRSNQDVLSIGFPLDMIRYPGVGKVIGPTELPEVVIYDNQPNCRKRKVQDGQELCLLIHEQVGTTIPQFPGGSGSPVFNLDSELVGLISTASLNTNFGTMVYLKDIKRVLNKF